jgi:hypothetical protein
LARSAAYAAHEAKTKSSGIVDVLAGLSSSLRDKQGRPVDTKTALRFSF